MPDDPQQDPVSLRKADNGSDDGGSGSSAGGSSSGSTEDPNQPLGFDPYRFGAPDHPIPPEYAPPGYVPPPQFQQPQYQQPQYQQPQYGQPQQQPFQQQPPQFGQYPPPPPPQLGWGGQRRQANPHGKAVASLVLGIASIVLCWLTVLDALPVIIAIVLGLIALRDSKLTPNREGRGLALAGIICASIGAVLAIALTVLIYTRFSACLNLSPGSPEYSTCIRNHL